MSHIEYEDDVVSQSVVNKLNYDNNYDNNTVYGRRQQQYGN